MLTGIDAFGSGRINHDRSTTPIREHFALHPKGLVAMLDLPQS